MSGPERGVISIKFGSGKSKRGLQESSEEESVPLPRPSQDGVFAVEKAIARRRSRRTYLRRSITRVQLSQLLWAAQGVTDSENGLRAAPSAGALYPLELHIFVGGVGVEGLTAGVYHYETDGHRLKKTRDGDHLKELEAAALDQEVIGMSSICVVISAVFSRTTGKYGPRGRQYVHQECGAAAENVYLQATALGLGTVIVGAFTERAVSKAVGLGPDETPLCLLPIGMPMAE
jgi:SagB-type dehydrogenase family enzyme